MNTLIIVKESKKSKFIKKFEDRYVRVGEYVRDKGRLYFVERVIHNDRGMCCYVMEVKND